jgi:hypothetical protein
LSLPYHSALQRKNASQQPNHISEPHKPDYPVSYLSQERIKRRPVLGDLINEYERAA